MTVLAAGLLDFRAAVFSDGWIAGLLGLWGDGLILCIKAHCFNASDGIHGFNSCERRDDHQHDEMIIIDDHHRSEDVSFYFATLYMLRSPAYF